MNQPKHSPDTLGSEIDDNLDREVDMILKEISERDSNERGSNEKNVGGTISTAQSRFTGLKNALRHVKDTFNYYYEMAISKTLARFLIGSEIDGPLQYKAPERWTNTDNDNLVHENMISDFIATVIGMEQIIDCSSSYLRTVLGVKNLAARLR